MARAEGRSAVTIGGMSSDDSERARAWWIRTQGYLSPADDMKVESLAREFAEVRAKVTGNLTGITAQRDGAIADNREIGRILEASEIEAPVSAAERVMAELRQLREARGRAARWYPQHEACATCGHERGRHIDRADVPTSEPCDEDGCHCTAFVPSGRDAYAPVPPKVGSEP